MGYNKKKAKKEIEMQRITSKDNELIKHIKKLKDKKYRDESQEYIVEGIKMIEEAINEKANIKKIIICEDCEKSESIPKETQLTDIISYHQLANMSEWIDKIEEIKKLKLNRSKYAKDVADAGYDAKESAKLLEDKYLGAK